MFEANKANKDFGDISGVRSLGRILHVILPKGAILHKSLHKYSCWWAGKILGIY